MITNWKRTGTNWKYLDYQQSFLLNVLQLTSAAHGIKCGCVQRVDHLSAKIKLAWCALRGRQSRRSESVVYGTSLLMLLTVVTFLCINWQERKNVMLVTAQQVYNVDGNLCGLRLLYAIGCLLSIVDEYWMRERWCEKMEWRNDSVHMYFFCTGFNSRHTLPSSPRDIVCWIIPHITYSSLPFFVVRTPSSVDLHQTLTEDIPGSTFVLAREKIVIIPLLQVYVFHAGHLKSATYQDVKVCNWISLLMLDCKCFHLSLCTVYAALQRQEKQETRYLSFCTH